MKNSQWMQRWEEGQIGWHEATGNANLPRYWGSLQPGKKVLVPLCGKSADLGWLLGHGHDVTGVELSALAAKAFFEENAIAFSVETVGAFDCYKALDLPLRIFCGDYLAFDERGFDALYDRAALIALSSELRPDYASHTAARLKAGAELLIITLEYEQSKVDGPPFSVGADEVIAYWPDVTRVAENDSLDSCPPRFIEAGLRQVNEVIWRRS